MGLLCCGGISRWAVIGIDPSLCAYEDEEEGKWHWGRGHCPPPHTAFALMQRALAWGQAALPHGTAHWSLSLPVLGRVDEEQSQAGEASDVPFGREDSDDP